MTNTGRYDLTQFASDGHMTYQNGPHPCCKCPTCTENMRLRELLFPPGQHDRCAQPGTPPTKDIDEPISQETADMTSNEESGYIEQAVKNRIEQARDGIAILGVIRFENTQWGSVERLLAAKDAEIGVLHNALLAASDNGWTDTPESVTDNFIAEERERNA